jgi:threonine synthase
MSGLSQSGAFTLAEPARDVMGQVFRSGSCGEAETAETIRATLAQTGVLTIRTPPSQWLCAAPPGETPMVTLATAHPSKFPRRWKPPADAPRPSRLGQPIMARPEKYQVLPAQLGAIEQAIEAHTRALEVTH